MVSIQTGKVVNGQVVVDDDASLPEGQVVGILVREAETAFDLSTAEEEKIAQAVAELDRGEGLSESEFWANLDRGR